MGETSTARRCIFISATTVSGWIGDELRDEVRMYYGAADTRIGLATARLSAVLDYVRACLRPQQRRRGDPSEGI
jgi:hypothetical protein